MPLPSDPRNVVVAAILLVVGVVVLHGIAVVMTR